MSKCRAPVPLAERLPTLCDLKAGTARMGDPCRSDGSGTSWGLTYHKEQVTNRHRGLRWMEQYMHDRSYGSSRILRITLECTILHISLVLSLCVEVCLALCTIVQESLPRGAKICGVGVSSCGSARMSSPRSLACLLVLSTHLSRANPPCDSTRCSLCSANWV